ncbi:LysR family transcriptional regulator (plasmid) [Skermanella mucosa]|uniref:LysR substrate-binding domain-containing protein n=1 Tax=Skermanella mucosa TaxID=1789672 RepID=UPI00192C2666|nr:LysR substrate-binding domain-containing protein [Skermanella mucosa]UEM24193.1 LysR family transcriptional regulator [Skermanella mucosa]
MQNRLSIKSIQAFEAAARLGSFAAAADELAVTPSAVSHQVKLLEEQLGVPLFHRIHRAVVLTDAGQHLATEVIAAFSRIDAATRTVAVAGTGAVLTVHSTPSFASQWLMRRLARFGETHPGIDIRLNASMLPVTLNQGTVDVDIRYNPGTAAAGAVMVPFPDDTIVPLCSPSLANGIKPIRRPADLANHTLIHSEITILSWRDWGRRHRRVRLDMERGPRFDRSFMAISAAVDGLGVCLDSLLLAEQEIRTGKLIVPFPGDCMKAQGHGFLTLRTKTDLPKIRSFREWLFAELGRTLDWAERFVANGMTNPAP